MYDELKALLEDKDLLAVNHRYELMHPVFDSWMEWEIKVEHPTGEQTPEVSGFSPRSAIERGHPYPKVLTRLGCSIWKLRRDVNGDVPGWLEGSQTQECKDALDAIPTSFDWASHRSVRTVSVIGIFQQLRRQRYFR